MLIKRTFLLVLLSVSLTSCATVFSGTKQNITFDSNEKGVEVYINNEKKCEAPCTVQLEKSRDTIVIVGRKKGFDDAVLTVTSNVNILTIVNLISISTGSFGLTTDVVNSSAWEYQPNAFYLDMVKTGSETSKKRSTENKLKRYILDNYSEVKADITYDKSQDYLLALSSMTGLSIEKVKALALGSQNEADLIDKLIDEMNK